MKLIQVTSGIAYEDAITSQMLLIHDYFSSKFDLPGSSNRSVKPGPIYAEHIPDACFDDKKYKFEKLEKIRFQPEDLLLMQYGSSFFSLDFLKQKMAYKILFFQNVTPAHYFLPYNLMIAGRQKRALQDLKILRDAQFDLVLCHSEVNAQIVSDLGFSNISTIGYMGCDRLLDIPRTDSVEISEKSRGRENDTGQLQEQATVLFVGRMVPNKNHKDLIKIFYFMKKIKADVKLVLAGPALPGLESYIREIQMLIRGLGLEDSVTITDMLDRASLSSLYRNSDLFLCCSLHEGFCVPVVEAMTFDLPLLVFDTPESAARETAGSGVSFSNMDYPSVASLAVEMLENKELRNRIIIDQRKAVQKYRSQPLLEQFAAMIGATEGRL